MDLTLKKVEIGCPPTYHKEIKRVSDAGLQEQTEKKYP